MYRPTPLRFVLALLVTVLGMPVASTALAQDDPDDARVEQARAVFQAGRIAFESASYEDALRHFREAYRLSGRAELLYNIGVSADRLREDQQALEAFEQYLRETPADAPQRADAEARVRVLRRQVEARASGEADPSPRPDGSAGTSPTPPPPSGGDGGLAPVGFGVMGGGLAVLVAGAVMLGIGQAEAGTVESAQEGSRWTEVAGAWERADWMRVTGWVLAGIGLAAAAAGLSLALLPSGGGSREGVSLRIQPTGLQLVWRTL